MRALFTAAFLTLPMTFASFSFAAESPVGRWQTIDDETGKPKSVVEIQQAADGSLSGEVAARTPCATPVTVSAKTSQLRE